MSECGQVRSHKNKTTYSDLHGVRRWKQRVLKQKICKNNTCRLILYKDKKAKTWLVHRLVAIAFIPKVEGKDFINHKDGSRLNNHASNLEWCTSKENNNHGFDNNLMKTNHPIKLININNGEEHLFRSKARASEFLGKNKGYIHLVLKRGHKNADGYIIIES